MTSAPPADPWGRDLHGRLHELTIESTLLRENPLGDPASRPLLVYTPAGWPAAAPYRSLWVLQGFTGQVDMWRNRTAFQPTLVERMDAAIASGELPPVVVAFVDTWTSYGGSQFLDSAGTGRYLSYLCDEAVPLVDGRFQTGRSPGARAVMGKSSGGYGALMALMLRPDVWGGAGALAADSAFELCYLPDFPIAWRALRSYQGSIPALLAAVRSNEKVSADDFAALNAVAMAACYSPGPDRKPELPWDGSSGALREAVWARWLEHDPVRCLERHMSALRGKAISIECGLRDEFRLYVGAQQMHLQLEKAGQPHRFELFDGTHGPMQSRYPATAAFLLGALARSGQASEMRST